LLGRMGGSTVRLQAIPQRMPNFWRRGMPRSQIQKSMMMPKTNPMTSPRSMSACVPSDTSSITRSNRRDPSRMPPPRPTGSPSPLFCSSHSSSNSTDSRSDSARPLCIRREWNCVRRISTSVCENPARSLWQQVEPTSAPGHAQIFAARRTDCSTAPRLAGASARGGRHALLTDGRSRALGRVRHHGDLCQLQRHLKAAGAVDRAHPRIPRARGQSHVGTTE
jgi:hypothetical protein